MHLLFHLQLHIYAYIYNSGFQCSMNMAGLKSLTFEVFKECVFHPTMFVPDRVREQFSEMACVNSPKNPTKSSPSPDIINFHPPTAWPANHWCEELQILDLSCEACQTSAGVLFFQVLRGNGHASTSHFLEVHRFSQVPLEFDKPGLIFSSKQGLASFTNKAMLC